MQLNKFTDYALRVLMYTARPSEQPYTIAEIANDLEISQNHLVKIVHFMAKQQWIITTRGKGGGIRLHPKTLDLNLGVLVRTLQGDQHIVECNSPVCILRAGCGLKGVLDQALDHFYQYLDRYTLADALSLPATYSSNSPIPVLMLNP